MKKAYFKLALQHHPDKNNGSAASTERFKVISAAFEVNTCLKPYTGVDGTRLDIVVFPSVSCALRFVGERPGTYVFVFELSS